jgi:hypothetical protein
MRTLSLILLLWVCSSTQALTVSLSPQALEEQLFLDAEDGELELTLFDAALVASHAAPAVAQGLRIRHQALVREAQIRILAADSEVEAAAVVYSLMHEKVLSGRYRAESTSLVEAMNSGDFNCVSATILFQSLATNCGLSVTPMATPSHVYSRLEKPSKTNIQTTCPDWFDYMDRPDLQQAAMRRTPGWSPDVEPRQLSSVQLIGKIYYNRGVFQLNDHLFAVAETNFLQSMQLDQVDESAQENLLATWNNWALAKCSEGDFADASRLILTGIQRDAEYGPFQMNDLHIHQRWAQEMCKEGDFSSASQLLKSCELRRPEVTLFGHSRKAVHRLWARSLEESGQPAEARRIKNDE